MLRRTLVALWLAAAAPAAAQEAATLVADSITFDQGSLVASGDVEILSEGRILRARSVRYLRDEDRLEVEGPLTLVDGADRVLVADFAALGQDLRASVLRGARLVLDQRLQIAATEVASDEEGRYTQLYQAVASSCEVCPGRPVPLWQIRARRIVQDQQENQLYFEGARFEVVGVPILWLPRMRLPGPGNERATGLLAPRFSSDDQLGFGVTVPSFIALGPSADLTVAPYATFSDTRALNLRYRQAFRSGAIEINGAVARDDVRPDITRGYLFADGAFRLPREYQLEFAIETTSDDDFLLEYDISEADRLESRIALARVERDNRFLAEAIAFRTLRQGETSDTQPTRVATITREQRRDLFGGIGFWQLEAHGRERAAGFEPVGFGPGSARDVLRLSASAGWRRSTVRAGGMVVTTLAEIHADAYRVTQDPAFDEGVVTALTPYAGIEARLPLARVDADGVTHLLEPVAQAILAPTSRARVPNEDSITPEFDEGNLLATSRFPGRDARELGNRVNLGLRYARTAPSGLQLALYAGRTVRDRDLRQFPTGTGLDSKASDWLVSGSAVLDDRFSLLARTLFDDQANTSRSEAILRSDGEGYALETRYTYLESDARAGRPRDTSELALDGSLDLSRDWTASANWRYDFVTDDASRAGLGLAYRSDCVTVEFDVERRFTSTTTLEPTTRFGLSVELAGFGADARPGRTPGRCGT
ncbi:LPS-assembly protein LptD [Jannaschia sp. W003]|uniref:LPS-assembly protein LptD n=1 Tax=Jannaschia sp. W003 TaxID=2867012 RepID=UPI0021A95F6F|nr:LPS assembly protein LptD [Jannaschia sp. W003]UWQ20818.1 LPS assembly protein LptD [Jannaschia sp. W003]